MILRWNLNIVLIFYHNFPLVLFTRSSVPVSSRSFGVDKIHTDF